LKAVRILLVFLIVGILLSGCTDKTAKNTEDVQKLLMKLKSYRCDVVFAVTNNKSTNVYKAKHLYKFPDQYRIEILEPSELKGQTTIYSGEKAYIYHPQLNTYLMTQNYNNSLEYSSFVGAFIESFKNNGGARFKLESFQDRQCYVLEIPIPGENPYRALEKIWIDAEGVIPVKAEILDKNNKISAQVLYENFEENPKLEDSLFQIEDK
jgi:outer membrane lipoprotein-sorting protein